jgi:Skp family chaperone for outer membrane proteins
MDTLREQLYLTVQSIADEKGYDLVISSRDVIAGAKSLDITEETLQRMNKNVSDIKLDIAPD